MSGFRSGFPKGNTKCTPEVREGICRDIERGATLDDAATLNGVGVRTFHEWMRKGEQGDERFYEFFLAVTAAKSEVRARTLRQIRHGKLPNGLPDWKAKAWWLERSYPDDFAPSATVSLKVRKELSDALEILKDRLSPDVYLQVIEALSAETSSGEIGGGASGSGEAHGLLQEDYQSGPVPDEIQ